jgi:hypothetical protein
MPLRWRRSNPGHWWLLRWRIPTFAVAVTAKSRRRAPAGDRQGGARHGARRGGVDRPLGAGRAGRRAGELHARRRRPGAAHGRRPSAADEGSVEASAAVLDLAARTGADTSLLVLLSGGTSPLLIAPVPPIGIAELRAATRLLLEAGADITALNTGPQALLASVGRRFRCARPAVRRASGRSCSRTCSATTSPPSARD